MVDKAAVFRKSVDFVLFLIALQRQESPTQNYIFPHYSPISSQIVRKNQVFCLTLQGIFNIE